MFLYRYATSKHCKLASGFSGSCFPWVLVDVGFGFCHLICQKWGTLSAPPALVTELRVTSSGPSHPTEAAASPPGQSRYHHHHLLASSLLRIQTKSMQTQHPDTVMLKEERGENKVPMKLHVILLRHPSAAPCVAPVLGPPGSSDASLDLQRRSQGMGRREQQHGSRLCFGWKRSPLAQESCVVFNDSLSPKENLQ